MRVDFAPLDVPLQRRLQTATVLQWVYSFLGLAPTCIFLFFYLLFTRYWLISVLYATWWYFDYDTPTRGGRRAPFMCGLKFWGYMRDYFPVKVHYYLKAALTSMLDVLGFTSAAQVCQISTYIQHEQWVLSLSLAAIGAQREDAPLFPSHALHMYTQHV